MDTNNMNKGSIPNNAMPNMHNMIHMQSTPKSGTMPMMEQMQKPAAMPMKESIPKPSTMPMMEQMPKPAAMPMMENMPKPATMPMMENMPKPATMPMMENMKKPSTMQMMENAPNSGLMSKMGKDTGIMPACEREAMLWRVQAYEFACLEVGLFLDTHPHDQTALSYFKQYTDLRRKAEAEYTEKFGPLTMCQADLNMSSWKWIENPWPWEMGCEV